MSKWPGDGVAVEPRDNKLMFLWCVDANQPRTIVLQHKRKQFWKILPHRSVKMKNRYDSNNQNNNVVTAILISINSQQLTDWDNVFPLPLSLSRKSVQIREREQQQHQHHQEAKQQLQQRGLSLLSSTHPTRLCCFIERSFRVKHEMVTAGAKRWPVYRTVCNRGRSYVPYTVNN